MTIQDSQDLYQRTYQIFPQCLALLEEIKHLSSQVEVKDSDDKEIKRSKIAAKHNVMHISNYVQGNNLHSMPGENANDSAMLHCVVEWSCIINILLQQGRFLAELTDASTEQDPPISYTGGDILNELGDIKVGYDDLSTEYIVGKSLTHRTTSKIELLDFLSYYQVGTAAQFVDSLIDELTEIASKALEITNDFSDKKGITDVLEELQGLSRNICDKEKTTVPLKKYDPVAMLDFMLRLPTIVNRIIEQAHALSRAFRKSAWVEVLRPRICLTYYHTSPEEAYLAERLSESLYDAYQLEMQVNMMIDIYRDLQK